MLFNSVYYGLFLVAVFIAFWALVRWRLVRMAVLLAASYYFYANWNPIFILLLWFSSSLDFILGWSISTVQKPWRKKLLLIISISMNLGILTLFKYADFFIGSVSDGLVALGLDPLRLRVGLILPVGLSFYTFKTMSYVIDIYRGKLTPTTHYHEYLLYVGFFPQLVAGPIVRAGDLLPQFESAPALADKQGAQALWLIMCGLFKKVVIADVLALNLVDRVFSLPEMYTSWEALAAIYGYALQIYCDFSGYSDIAIGSAMLLGFRTPPNFDRPYLSRNLRDFWRRWHISLSFWFRDYLYIPLGGSRRGAWRTYFNLWITMMLCGLWHGAEWKFIFWGFLHGMGLMFTRLTQRARKRTVPRSRGFAALAGILTFHYVCFCWIFFKADNLSGATDLLRVLFSFTGGMPNFVWQVAVVLVLGYALHWTPPAWEKSLRGAFGRLPAHAQGLVLFILIVVLYSVASSDVVPFIYYQF